MDAPGGGVVEAFQNVMWIAAAMAFLSALIAQVAIEGRPQAPVDGLTAAPAVGLSPQRVECSQRGD
jgi:hypothetical protein